MQRLGRLLWGVCGGALLALGCSPQGKGPVDYHTDVAPIMAERCNACHVAGGIAPFELGTYEQAAAVAPLLPDVINTRTMPPWAVQSDGSCQTFREPRWLRDDELETINTWVEQGLREGDYRDPPQPAKPPALDEVDLSLQISQPYTPSAAANDDYHCFVVDPQLASDKFIIGSHVIPGELQVVHHVILYIPVDQAASDEAEALDAAEPGDGYTCFGGPGVDALVGPGWAPGTPAGYLPDGTGYPIAAGSKLIMQVHYNLLAGVIPDQTQIDMDLADNVPLALLNIPLADGNMVLPPGQEYVSTTYTLQLPSQVPKLPLYGVFPHMHTMGVDLHTEQQRGEKTTCLTQVNRWDFNWQQAYLYEEPLDIMGNDTISLTCGYDTTSRTTTTYWGDGTQDEMCLNFMMVGVPPSFLPESPSGGFTLPKMESLADLAQLGPH